MVAAGAKQPRSQLVVVVARVKQPGSWVAGSGRREAARVLGAGGKPVPTARERKAYSGRNLHALGL